MDLTTNFNVNTDGPIDKRTRKNTITERDAIPVEFRYTGLKVFVEETGVEYMLKGGLTNLSWYPVGSSLYQVKVTGVSGSISIANAIPAGAMLMLITIKNSLDGTEPEIDIGESPGGHELIEKFIAYDSWNIIDFKKVYENAQTLYISGHFDGSTIDIYINYQLLIS